MTLSLRGRLLIGVISLMLLGLLALNVAIYASLQNFLVGRVDAELRAGVEEVANVLGATSRGPIQRTAFPGGTVAELIAPDGSVANLKVVGAGFSSSTTSPVTPVLPATLPYTELDVAAAPFTVVGSDGKTEFRMTDWREGRFGGQFVVLAVPLTDVQSTLRGLLVSQAVVSAAVVAGTALLALLIIQVGLRPLRRMGAVAGEIAAGDYSRRVEPATSKTEIGRLGLALNAMLSQIEAAFEQRTASEKRLRRFIADASHELRTPLTSIRGYSEMLRRGAAESPPDADVARRRIEEESVRMSTLVDDMLLIARLDQGRPLETKPVDLQVIAQDAAADARAVAPKREITVSAPESVMVSGDDTRLRQAVANIVRNALVHTPAGTPIEIAVTTQNGTAHLSVADHGSGLRVDDRDRIFEPFYRADPSRSRDSGGAGLGLSIVNAVIAAHGGRVEVKETSGGGATFSLELPLAAVL
ncbi:MAG TPA: HAMP domain-containing sensor histidine kinase [Candidatus Dormibacteraeota bacterium]|nr:HAMP domain-containing sensor histidine kinase [Candidatus Dormibacteraeota bacterium]